MRRGVLPVLPSGSRLEGRLRCGRGEGVGIVPIGSYLSMLMGGDVRGRVNW